LRQAMIMNQPLSTRALADQSPTPEDAPVIMTVGFCGYDILRTNLENY
jgi:hypothetical protein